MATASAEEERPLTRREAVAQLVLLTVGVLAPIVATLSIRIGGDEQWWFRNWASAASVVVAAALLALLRTWARPLLIGIVVGSAIAALFVIPLSGVNRCEYPRTVDGHVECG